MRETNVTSTLLTAAVVFVSTNVDDIVLLSVLFADRHLPARAVVLGQFIGIGTLVLVSTIAGVAAVAVPAGWIALLGAIPLALGLSKLVRLLRAGGRSAQRESAPPSVADHRSAIGTVVAVTLANGADNLGVYIPLFAADRTAIGVYASVFAVLTAVWCWLGHRLVHNRVMGEKLRRYGHILLPIVLIVLGIYILSGFVSEL